MSTYVPGEGPLNAKIVLVGEAPGREEDARGRPFVGSSGQLLNQMLSNAGLTREEVYVTNVVKHRPPKNNFDVFYNDSKRQEPSADLVKAIESLKEEIRRIGPNVIVALGNEPLRALCNKRGIDKWRGSIISTDLGKVVPTYHPAYVLRMFKSKAIVEFDLQRAKEESLSPNLGRPLYEFQPNPTFEEVMDFLRSRHDRLSFDLETTGRHVRCLGFGYSPTKAICIPFMTNSNIRPGRARGSLFAPVGTGGINNHWSLAEEEQILKECNRVFRDGSTLKLAQNFPFDSSILAQEFGFLINGFYLDTMVAFHALYCELPKSLDFLTSLYTRAGYYADHDRSDDYAHWTYNCFDCAVTYEVSQKLEEELEENDLSSFFFYHLMPSLYSVTAMSNRGIAVDQFKREQMAKEKRARLAEILTKIHTLAGGEINPDSSKQMQEFLYDKLRLPQQTNYQTGRATANEEALVALKKAAPQHSDIIDSILEYRSTRVLLSTFLESGLSTDGRMRSSFNLCGTVTGRLSSSQTLFGEGGNLQNIPEDVRQIYIPDPGKVLIVSDLSQAEFRFVVWDAPMLEIVERYRADPSFDIHSENAKRLFGQVTSELRNKAKPIAHGGNYKIGPRKASKVYDLTYNEAKEKLELYRQVVPEVQRWWANVQQEMVEKRFTRNPMGRKRVFFDRVTEDETHRQALSWRAQSTVADLINRALWLLDEMLPSGCSVLLQIHDEIVVQCPPERVGEVLPIIKTVMEYPIVFPGVDTPMVIPTEPRVGGSWYKGHCVDAEKWLLGDKCKQCYSYQKDGYCVRCGSPEKWADPRESLWRPWAKG